METRANMAGLELIFNKIYYNAILQQWGNSNKKGLGRVLVVRPTFTPHEAKYAVLLRFGRDVSYYIFNDYSFDGKGLVIMEGKRKTLPPEKVILADKFLRDHNL